MTRALLAAAVLAAALAATAAHADVWQRAIDRTDATKDRYDQAMQTGDELVTQANARTLTASRITSLVDQAIRAYREAATIKPAAAEPYFRIANTLDNFFVSCEGSLITFRPPTCPPPEKVDPVRGAQTVEAWDAFEARAPLDPRVAEILFGRAILRTKLVDGAKQPKPLLEGALRDYQALLDRADGMTLLLRQEQVWGNLAETYMMLGRLDESIEAYETAIKLGGDTSAHYGLAVALDRDERTTEALEVIRRQGLDSFRRFQMQYADHEIFYVPRGEEYYYFALISETFGYVNEAIRWWQLFQKSGAHPQFQHRAKAHLDALQVKQKTAPRPPTPLEELDPFR